MNISIGTNFKSIFFVLIFSCLFVSLNENVSAQKVRFRSQIAPNCNSGSTIKYADIFADGNIAVQGSYACRGAFIYDISNPDQPVLAAWYNPGNNQQFLEAVVVGTRGYFGSGNGGGVHIVDLTNPYNPVLLGVVNTTKGNGFDRIHEMVVHGNYLIENYNGFSNKIIKIINISNPANPVFIRDLNPLEMNWVHAIHIRNNLMFTSGWGNSSNRGKTEIYDISNIESPVRVGFIEDASSTTAGNNMHSSWSYDGIVFANSDKTLTSVNSTAEFIVSINPNETSRGEKRFGLSGSKSTEFPEFPFSFAVKKDAVTGGNYTGEIIEKNVVKTNFNVVEGDVLKISVEAGTVKYYKNNQPAYTSQQTLPTAQNSPGNLATPLFARAAIFHLNNSINNAKISNAGIFETINWKTTDNQIAISANTVTKVAGCNDCRYLYSCRETSDGDVRVYDVKDFSQPLLVKRIKAGDLGINAISPHNPVVMGNKLYVAWYTAGIQVFDLSEPANPKRLGEYDTYLPEFTDEQRNAALLEKQKNAAGNEPWDLICGTTNFELRSALGYDGNWAVYPFLGEDKILLGDMASGLITVDVNIKNPVSDFDGDRRTDFSTFTPSSGLWQIEKSSDNQTNAVQFGASTDKIVAGDYDGDGKSDVAVFRPLNGVWYILGSKQGFYAFAFGANGDVPMAADYDGDNKTDVAVFRPSTETWYIQSTTQGFYGVRWGANSDKTFTGDYDGDGRADLVAFRPSNGVWYILQSSTGTMRAQQFGASTDKPLSGDFDGDGKSDITAYRPANGAWYSLSSKTNSLVFNQFGSPIDVPVPADYDGDGRADIAVFRPGNNVWYRLDSASGAFNARVFGQSGDVPSPASTQAQ